MVDEDRESEEVEGVEIYEAAPDFSREEREMMDQEDSDG